jgi:hypothetical protein
MLADFSLDGAGRVAVIVGVVLWCYQRLQSNNTASNQSYEQGFDQGYERGWKERDEEVRPKLVDLNCRRGNADKAQGLSSAGRVVDRG